MKLHEAEAAGRPPELVQAHDDAADLAAAAVQCVDLLLRRVEGEVAHVESGGLAQLLLLLLSASLEENGGEERVFKKSPFRTKETLTVYLLSR